MALNSKLSLLLGAAGVLAVSLWTAPASRNLAAAPLFASAASAAPAAPSAVDDVQQVYLDNCSICHGEDGAGNTAKGRKLKVKDLRSPEVQKLSAADIANAIANGKGENMAGFEQQLGKDMCQKLALYVRGLAKK